MVSTGKKIGYGVGGLIVVAGGAWAILANQSNNNSSSTAKVASAGSFKGDYKNAKTAVKNGSLTVTTPGTASSPISFGGYLEFTQWSAAASQLGPASNSIFYSDSKNRLENGGPANFKIDKDKKTVTITLRKDLKWSDGKQVVARDVAFSLETLATNEVATSNFSTAYTNIKGVTDFQNGKADSISGIKYNDGENGKKLTISYTSLPAALAWGDGIPTYALPYHDLKDVKSKDLATSPKVTKNPLSFAAYKVASVSSDSTVKFTRNSEYYGKKAKLASITYYVNQDQTKLSSDLGKQKFDIVTSVPSALWKDGNTAVLSKFNNAKGYASTGQYDSGYWELYFNLGHTNAKTSKVVQDRSTPLQNKNVRKAVGYAMNVGDVTKKYGNGLVVPTSTLVSKNITKSEFYNKSVKGYQTKSSGDVKNAAKYLKKAGYKKDANGYFAKSGKELTLTYLARSGKTTSEAEAKAYIAAWKAAGIKVNLYQDKLVDPSTWQSIVLANNNDWDITDGGWSEGSAPTFDQLWADNAPYNLGHVTSKALTKNLKETAAATSDKELIAGVKAFQKLVVDDEAYTIPTLTNIDVQLVNGRVKGWTTAPTNNFWAKLSVTSDKAVTSGNPRSAK
ncbi:ABC transporter substrate-binding protein [Weissella soli]|uniref:ABC transporter substrate-binding protein n=1 Tax=Weissella soli TaxID=155866 RepID=UPI00359F67B2